MWWLYDWKFGRNSFDGLTDDERKAKEAANAAGNTQEEYY